ESRFLDHFRCFRHLLLQVVVGKQIIVVVLFSWFIRGDGVIDVELSGIVFMAFVQMIFNPFSLVPRPKAHDDKCRFIFISIILFLCLVVCVVLTEEECVALDRIFGSSF
ncbi:hypothetical protein PFISCL1PPCAC_25961, partial [Pristionchus fissidentatus]